MLQSTCLSDDILVLSEHVDVLPKKDVHPTQRVINATRPFDTQESLLILENLSLVKILVDHFTLFTVCLDRCIDYLVYVNLSQWDVVFEVSDASGIQEIVHLVIHTFDNVLADITIIVWCHLKTILFHIIIEIPSNNLQDLLVVIFGNDLEPVLHLSLLDFDDFH